MRLQGDEFEQVLVNLRDAVVGCLLVELGDIPISETDHVLEIEV